jgi:hypothetical protein
MVPTLILLFLRAGSTPKAAFSVELSGKVRCHRLQLAAAPACVIFPVLAWEITAYLFWAIHCFLYITVITGS